MDYLAGLFSGFGTAAIVLLIIMALYAWMHDGSDIPAMALGTVFGVAVAGTWVGDVSHRVMATLTGWAGSFCGNFGIC